MVKLKGPAGTGLVWYGAQSAGARLVAFSVTRSPAMSVVPLKVNCAASGPTMRFVRVAIGTNGWIVTLNVQLADCGGTLELLTVQVTRVVPIANVTPLAGAQFVISGGTPPEIVGSGYTTTAPPGPVAGIVISAGHPMVSGRAPVTFTTAEVVMSPPLSWA